MNSMSPSDARMLEKPVKELKKVLDGTNPAKIKTACDQLDEMLKYADKRDGAYDSTYTK